jgi:hypothetical protein
VRGIVNMSALATVDAQMLAHEPAGPAVGTATATAPA